MDFEARKIRTAQGPRKLRAEREEYFGASQHRLPEGVRDEGGT